MPAISAGFVMSAGEWIALTLEVAFDRGAFLLDVLRLAHAIEHDVGALFGEAAGDGEPDPARRAGDDRGPGLQDHDDLLVRGAVSRPAAKWLATLAIAQ